MQRGVAEARVDGQDFGGCDEGHSGDEGCRDRRRSARGEIICVNKNNISVSVRACGKGRGKGYHVADDGYYSNS